MRDNFDPMTMVPESDDEALKCLEREDSILTVSLQGIYRAKRALNETVLEAYKTALLAHLGYIAGEDLKAGQIAQFNEEDGRFFAYTSERPSDFVVWVFEDVKKDQVIKEKQHATYKGY